MLHQPFTKSLVPESWFVMGRGSHDGRPFVLVARSKGGEVGTTWRLELTTNRNNTTDWRCVSHTDSMGQTITYSSPRNLSHSEVDTALRRACEPGEWSGTEWKAA
jgi:hypothetical protein